MNHNGNDGLELVDLNCVSKYMRRQNDGLIFLFYVMERSTHAAQVNSIKWCVALQSNIFLLYSQKERNNREIFLLSTVSDGDDDDDAVVWPTAHTVCEESAIRAHACILAK